MKRMYEMLLPFIISFAAGCSGGPGAPTTTDSADPSSESIGQSQDDLSSLTGCVFKSPPRCGARNCVAMCVTCFFDACMAAGGSCTECRREMESCKDDCGEQECPPSDAFCDFHTR